ncbi:MAG: CehA/McbA family metallohydrolase [Candidatus Hydrogenedentes bacterium]|nr:CehA/McbA family metallohydrolase [Candidatus Hydrogenedentota bacterium]
MKYAKLMVCLLFVACGAREGVQPAVVNKDADAAAAAKPGPDETETARKAALEKRALLPKGSLIVDITNVIGQHLPSRIDLFSYDDGVTISLDAPEGVLISEQPVGSYRAYVNVFEESVPIMVDVKDVNIQASQTADLEVSLLEGSGGMLSLRGFDSDGDLALDRVELAMGTDPYNAGSIPGRVERLYDTRVLNKATRWYCGELQAYSSAGTGTEDVASLVKRAEKANLDFLAITDRNTLAAADDPAYRSDRLACLPAMEWGTNEKGIALVYGPRTMLEPPTSVMAAQAECIRVQAQGGAWAIAHPAFPGKPWQWGLSFVNGVQVWFRGWREAPPMSLQHLGEAAKERKDGELIHSIAAAAAAINFGELSANGQGNLFYDYELVRGLMAGIIGGSGSGSPKVPLGRPLTYIHTRELSVPALLEGLRLGRTYVSSGPDGPKIYFGADVLSDGKTDVGIGGIIPLNVEVSFEVAVENALGMKLQVIENGRPIRTIPINSNDTGVRFKRIPSVEAAFRVRIIKSADPKAKGFGPLEILAITSPIYARDITAELLWRNPNFDPDKSWVRIQSKDMTEIDMESPESGTASPPLNIPQI